MARIEAPLDQRYAMPPVRLAGAALASNYKKLARMTRSLNNRLVFAVVCAITLAFFWLGLGYPLGLRVRGDALAYLKIADSLGGVASAWTYAGDRTIGFPLFEFAIHEALSIFSPTVYLLSWINTIGAVMLAIHLAASWLYAFWAHSARVIRSRTTAYVLFAFLATNPALIGHTTSPLSDTFSVDLILLGLVALSSALAVERVRVCLWQCGLAATCLGFSVLVRPASLLALFSALLVYSAVAMRGTHTLKLSFLAVGMGIVLVLAIPSWNCTEKYGRVCLQSPKTFNPNLSMQDGLRGARLMWSRHNPFPGTLPMVTDEIMFNNYYKQCQISSSFGFGDTSLMGCLLARPLTLPAFVAKKWIGLFDFFRFTPYMENQTPPWLRNVGRAYGALAWLGLIFCFVYLFSLLKHRVRSNARSDLASNAALVFLAVFSLVVLAQHTALHTEERYGFPLIPICSVVLFRYCEWAIFKFRTGEWRTVAILLFMCLVSVALFVAQINAWDSLSFAHG